MKISKILSLIPLVGSLLLTVSCADEIELNRIASSDTIQFKCVDSGDWSNAISRSADGSDAASHPTNPNPSLTAAGVFRLDNSDSAAGEPMYIHSFDYDDVVAHPAPASSDKSRVNSADSLINNDNLFPNFGVTAFHTDGSDPTLYMFNNIVKPGSDNLWHFRDSERYWPSSGTMKFIGCYPSGSTNGGISLSVENNTVKIDHTTPNNSYQQRDLCVALTDANCKADKRPASVEMKFYHAFTRIKIVASKNMLEGRINYVKFKNIYTKGTLTFPESFTMKDYLGADGTKYSRPENLWTPDETTKGEVERSGEYLDPAAYDDEKGYIDLTTKNEHMFMLLPQILPDNAEIEISFTDKVGHPELFKPEVDTNDPTYNQQCIDAGHTLTANIGGSEWLQGCTKIYKISSSGIEVSPTLEVPDDYVFPFRGDDSKFSVKSTAIVTEYGKTPREVQVPWKVEFLDASGNVFTPGWISGIPTSEPESVTDRTFTVGFCDDTEDIRPHTDWIKGQKETFNEVEDLSKREKKGTINTANCYVINHPGAYKFPLVYGNAIKDSKDYPESFTYTGLTTNDYVLKRFLNHVDHPIMSPWIKDTTNYPEGDVRTPKDAKLVWQDAQNLIKSCSIDDDKKYLTFTTGKSKEISEGNAIIAVVDNKNEIMWSWHIWVTDYIPRLKPSISNDPYDPTVLNPADKEIYSQLLSNNLQGAEDHLHTQKDTIMGVPLGWCSDRIRIYHERNIQIRVTQNIKGIAPGLNPDDLSKTINLKQTEGKIHLDGNAPYYQFGRKDPIRPFQGSRYNNNNAEWSNKTLYDIDNKVVSYERMAAPKSIGESITSPHKFITAEYDWCSSPYYNLWSANIAGEKDVMLTGGFEDVKTIYDPSPAGYEVPDLFAFTFFAFQGESRNYNEFFKRLNSPHHGKETTKDTDDTPRNYFFDNLGMEFFAHYMKGVGWFDESLGRVFFPALGARARASGAIAYGNNRGYYWASTPAFYKFDFDNSNKDVYWPDKCASSFGFNFESGKESIMPMVQNTRANGQNVRPIRVKNF